MNDPLATTVAQKMTKEFDEQSGWACSSRREWTGKKVGGYFYDLAFSTKLFCWRGEGRTQKETRFIITLTTVP